jgi:hypothetical protein
LAAAAVVAVAVPLAAAVAAIAVTKQSSYRRVCFSGEAPCGLRRFVWCARDETGRWFLHRLLRSLLSNFIRKTRRMRIAFWLSLSVAVLSALPLKAQREKLPWDDRVIVEKTWPKAIKTSTGLRYIILKEGTGDARPMPGDLVSVLYQGRLLDGKVFSEETNSAQAFRPRVGREQLIPAWEEAIKQMRRGEKRLIIVPFELGYGTKGDPPRIPRRATLVFEIELLDFGKE